MFACIYIPDFPVEALVRNEPLLRHRAVAVLDGKAPLVRLIALNEQARRLGMEAGMTKLQAGIFAEGETVGNGGPRKRPGHIGFVDELPRSGSGAAVLRQRSHEQEKSAHAALLDIGVGFSPRVESTAEGRIILDLCGLERLHGSASNMARHLMAQLSAAGMEGNVAIAANPDTAMHAACGFSSTTIIPMGEEQKRLGVLPLQVLLECFDLPRETSSTSQAERKREQLREQILDTLERWGVRDFRTLALLPEHALASRLGETGARLQRLARGGELRTLTLCEPELRFEEALELETPVETLEPLAFVMNRLLEQLCARLESRALAAHELKIRLQLERLAGDEETTTAAELRLSENGADGSFYTRSIQLPVAMRDPKVFLKLLQLDLATHPPGAPVLRLWISAEPAPPRCSQRGLFLPLTPEAEKLEITLARIISIVGEHRAGSALLLDTHRPDAFVMERFANPEDNRTTTLTMSDSEISYALRIFRPPVALRVGTAEGRPIAIERSNKTEQACLQGKILWSAGPWRGSGDWWSEQGDGPEAGAWDREEWDIALQSQTDRNVGLYRIYRDIGSGKWFAHASYD